LAKIIVGGRIRVYDDAGNLVEERDATAEDIIEVLLDKLVNEYVIEGTLTIGNQTYKFTLRFKKVSG